MAQSKDQTKGCIGCAVLFIIAFVFIGYWVSRPEVPKTPEEIKAAAEREAAEAARREVDEAHRVTLEEFYAIQTGMTYQQVRDILGRDGEMQSENDLAGTKTQMFQWVNPGFSGGNMNAIFQDGKLVQKAQFGLK